MDRDFLSTFRGFSVVNRAWWSCVKYHKEFAPGDCKLHRCHSWLRLRLRGHWDSWGSLWVKKSVGVAEMRQHLGEVGVSKAVGLADIKKKGGIKGISYNPHTWSRQHLLRKWLFEDGKHSGNTEEQIRGRWRLSDFRVLEFGRKKG